MFIEQIANFCARLISKMAAAWSSTARVGPETRRLDPRRVFPRRRQRPRDADGTIRSHEEREAQRVFTAFQLLAIRSQSKGEQP